MTEAQAKWLRKLKDRGDLSPYGPRWRTNKACLTRGWVTWAPDTFGVYRITPAGLTALAEHEAAKAKPAAKEGR